MNGTFGKSAAKDVGDWTNNSELNPATNSPVTEDSVIAEGVDDAKEWRDDNFANSDRGVSAGAVTVQESETHSGTKNPGRTPGKAEGVEDPEKRGNEDS